MAVDSAGDVYVADTSNSAIRKVIAGVGVKGYRTNVRGLLKRIRGAFRDVDPEFAQIGNYARFGYRWIPEE